MTPDLSIVPFSPRLAAWFASLNQAWIEQYFRMEPADLEVLSDPEGAIIEKGGQIFFALDGEAAVGTVAAVRKGDTAFELAKMAVAPSHQGRGLGDRLGRAVIDYARNAGAQLLFLETSSRLPTAIRLYERLGFVHATPPRPSPYARSDVYMELRLEV